MKPSMAPGLKAGSLSVAFTLQVGFSFLSSPIYDEITFRHAFCKVKVPECQCN